MKSLVDRVLFKFQPPTDLTANVIDLFWAENGGPARA